MSYNAESIQVRSFREACRATPGMYLGADRQDGVFNCFMEILNNSCDEAIMKRGDTITITLDESLNKITVEDRGAGIPHGPNKDCKEVLIELFTSAHSSGKFNSTNYKKVRGLHGIGSSAVCVCSTEYEVWSNRDGGTWYLKFVDGIPQSEVAEKIASTTKTGTKISFTPDKSIFRLEENESAFEYERICNELELTSYFIPNVTFELVHNGKTIKYLSTNGLKDFAASKIQKPLHQNYIYGYKMFDDEVEVEVFAQWTAGKEQCYVFSNGALNIDGGTPVTGAKTAFTRTINSLAKTEFDGDMIRKGLVYIINIRHPKPIYQNQVKNKIQNAELKGYTQTVLTEAIKDFALKNKVDFDNIIEILKKEKRAEAAAENARQKVLDATKDIEKNQKRKVFASDKLKDAEHLGEDSVLLLVEGNSAAASMAMARDVKKYGILALRGKMINCLSNSEEDIFDNEEVKLLLSALNIIPGKYNGKKLRYGKVAIATDGDSDGSHIGLLVMAALQYLAPEFLQEGRLYWLRSPLWIVKNGKKEQYFFTDGEMDKARGSISGTIQRNKGLGSLSAEQARVSMFTPQYQRLEPIAPNTAAIELLYELMGTKAEPRTQFIMKNVDFREIKE